jgi:hypothetical protein
VENGNGRMTPAAKHQLDIAIGEMNAQALAMNLAELRTHYDERITALENEIAAMRTLVQNQSRVIGEALQRTMGAGSTERDDG